MNITNSDSDSISSWIFTSNKLFNPAVYFPLQSFMEFSINFMTSSDILFIWDSLLSSFAGPYRIPFCIKILPLRCALLENVLINVQ